LKRCNSKEEEPINKSSVSNKTLSPQKSIKLDHNYCQPSTPEKLQARLNDANAKLQSLKQKLQNSQGPML
jgi:hypothetical protein